MAGNERLADNQLLKNEALLQPTDAVAMTDVTNKDVAPAQETTESGPSIAATAQNPETLSTEVTTAAAETAAERSPKGKAKEELPVPTDKQKEDDSLSIELSDPQADAAANQEPLICTITLLLPTGARHPYKIDEKYLAKRSVEIPDVTESGRKDPFSISVYKLKELILREWRDEWDGKPASPSSIRLIFFGKLLDDKEQLKSMLSLTHSLTLARFPLGCITNSSQNTSSVRTVPILSTCQSVLLI